MEKVELGDPVGNFHYVEKRLKQGITVSRGGVGGGGARYPMVLCIMSPRKRDLKTAIRTVIIIQQWYITMENRNNLTRPKPSPSGRASRDRSRARTNQKTGN